MELSSCWSSSDLSQLFYDTISFCFMLYLLACYPNKLAAFFIGLFLLKTWPHGWISILTSVTWIWTHPLISTFIYLIFSASQKKDKFISSNRLGSYSSLLDLTVNTSVNLYRLRFKSIHILLDLLSFCFISCSFDWRIKLNIYFQPQK